MKKGLIICIAIAVVVFCVASYGVNLYNGLVEKQENATTALADLQSTYQRRMDLLTQAAKAVKAYAKHENETYIGVTEARAKATQITLDPSNLTSEKMQEFMNAQGEVSSALSRLMVVAEAYPELKANENYKKIMIQIEGAENRINEARQNYNNAVQEFNVGIRVFPANILNVFFGFDKMAKFEAEANAQKAPDLDL